MQRAISAGAVLALSCALPAFAAEVPGGKVAGWQGGAAEIFTYGHDEPIGRIREDGSVSFDLPTPPDSDQTVAQTFDRCRTGGLSVKNGAANVVPTMLFVKTGGDEPGLVAATNPETAAYQISWGQTQLVKGAFLRWLHVDGEAAVTGRCVEEMVTPSGPAEFTNELRLEFAPGWNLVRTTSVELMEHEDGSRHETHTIHDALQAMPDDAMWYLEAK